MSMLQEVKSGAIQAEKPMNFLETLEFFGWSQEEDFRLYGLVHRGQIPFLKAGHRLFFLRSELLKHMKEAAAR